MADLHLLTPEKILSIPVDYPERLYCGDCEQDIRKIYKKLSSLWHPDKHIGSAIDTAPVFAHVKALYEKAVKKIEEGSWNLGQVVLFTSIENKKYQVKYQSSFSFDLGQCYISSKFVTYVIDKENEDLMIRGIKAVSSIRYADDQMKKNFQTYVPQIHAKIETKDKFIIVVNKLSSFLVLKDVLHHFGGKMPVKHAAWIISSMYNLACFTHYNHLMHGGFSLDNYFICPETHEGSLIGGWWFTHNKDESLVALNKEALSVCPMHIINSKKAGHMLDLELIKLVGRQLLGDSSGVYLSKDKSIPEPIVQFLRDGAGNNTIKEYEAWHNVLLKSYGKRSFTEMKLTEHNLYSTGE